LKQQFYNSLTIRNNLQTLKKYGTLIVSLFVAGFLYSGCLVGHKIVYEIKVQPNGTGTATVIYSDIRSNATDDAKLDVDKTNLFSYMLKSTQFVNDMRKEGKDIISRKLYLEEGKLNGKAVYKFNKISDVENLSFEDNFYFVTLSLDDSVIATNGIQLKSATYKRILWDNTFTDLKFEILTEPAEGTKLVSLARFYSEDENK
jgi:hypothetical protein